MREFLEKNYKDASGKETIKLTIRALLEIISGLQNFDRSNVASVVTAADKLLWLVLAERESEGLAFEFNLCEAVASWEQE
ncbi:hypothetical protein ZWY2020_021315 [Hordeum vulgare]|nr:hypothetical protein ZWY2020_021315 [Hordeum vulgare]